MISPTDYPAILSNLIRNRPLDIDSDLFEKAELAAPSELEGVVAPPGDRLWRMSDPAVSYIGCRVTTSIAQPERVAARLAAIAVERRIHPVFFSYIPDCGMQRFGFRVEQLSGLTETTQKMLEAQLAEFWHCALVLDASDLDTLR